MTHLGNDCVGIAACAPTNAPTTTDADGIITNEWGMRFKSVGLYNEFYDFPLAEAKTIEDIDHYTFPAPCAEGRYDAAKATVEEYAESHAIVADLETSFFETAWYLVGLEKFLMDLTMGEPYIRTLLDKIQAVNTDVGKQLIELGADILWAGDDFGSQSGMMMAPDQWRRIFKPRIKRMFEAFREVNPDIKIAWHSCGSIVPIIPDFIEIGLDILNPIQPLAAGMEPEFLAREYGNDLVFFGGIDVQDLLPKKSPADIRAEVHRRIDILGKNGGYIVAPAHNIQDDTSVENMFAMFEAVKDY